MNKDLIARLTEPVIRELDMAEYADAFAGTVLLIQVNAPCVVEEVTQKETVTRDTTVAVVAIFTGEAKEEIAKLDDALLYWIYNNCLRLYNEFHDERKKN